MQSLSHNIDLQKTKPKLTRANIYRRKNRQKALRIEAREEFIKI